ncbi:MAG: hypothetical protein A2521_03535 [Deltaproteobacteria bacterium RIFOXYD12_FULL_57_12]|nr:MAG: hypothetical protein A2521_03535 [Deltaproteobacteria bacterium RIFOXYD12_FULL_57_12]
MQVLLLPDFRRLTGGPASFQRKLAEELGRRGVQLMYEFHRKEPRPDVCLLINAVKDWPALWSLRKKGIPVVQRLGGLNWEHHFLPLSLLHKARCEWANVNTRLVRQFIASRLVYQSEFVKSWWESEVNVSKKASMVIHNGVDLTCFSPDGDRYQTARQMCFISVEGNQGAGSSIALEIGKELRRKGIDCELLMFGKPILGAEEVYSRYEWVRFFGHVANDQLPFYYRGADFFVSTDVIAACPNSVIEAMACGVPILGYELGVLPELVGKTGGILVRAENDPRQGKPPGNISGLSNAALQILSKGVAQRSEVRALAAASYDINQMAGKYYEVLSEALA